MNVKRASALGIRPEPKKRLIYSRSFPLERDHGAFHVCGFLIRMLEGDSFKDFCKRAPRDNEMLELRKWLFSETK
jgi:hypothetical protein